MIRVRDEPYKNVLGDDFKIYSSGCVPSAVVGVGSARSPRLGAYCDLPDPLS